LVGLSGDGQDHCVWTCRHGRHVSVRRVASGSSSIMRR
jgi:hypothetical protein